MQGYELTDFEWDVIAPLLPNKPRGMPRVGSAGFERHLRGVADGRAVTGVADGVRAADDLLQAHPPAPNALLSTWPARAGRALCTVVLGLRHPGIG
jgi:transposase